MEDQALKALWLAYDQKIERSLEMNYRTLKAIQSQNVRSELRSLTTQKIVGVVIALPWIALLGSLLFFAVQDFAWSKVFFVVSIGAILFFTVKAVADYLRHLALLSRIDYEGNVTDTQEKLAALQSSTIRHLRVVWLQLPFYTTFYLSFDMLKTSGPVFWAFQLVLTGLFVWATVWLYRNIDEKNLDKKWFRSLMAGSGGKSVMKAMDFCREIEAFKQE